MTRRGFTGVLAGAGAFLASACSPLALFNSLAPRDRAKQAARDVAYGSDPRQKLDVYVPLTASSAPLATLLFFYGGGWNSGRRQDYAWVGQTLAAQGLMVVVPDYRLVPQVRYPAFVRDGAAAVRWVQDNAGAFGGDPRAILLAGHSAGAYIAMQLATDQAFLREIGVDPARLRGVAGLAGPYDFYPFSVPASRAAFGAWPEPQDTQPIAHVSPGLPPMFLAQGEKDDTVELSNTLNMAKALRGAGDRVEVKIYPGVDHPGIVLALSPLFRSKAPVLTDMTNFLRAAAAQA